MTDAEWLATTDFPGMIAALGDRVSVRKARLFACACCRQVESIWALQDAAAIVEIGERAADGAVTPGELSYQLTEAEKRRVPLARFNSVSQVQFYCLRPIVGRAGARDTLRYCGHFALEILQRQRRQEVPAGVFPQVFAGQWDLPPEYVGCAEVVCGVLRELFGDSLAAPRVPARWPGLLESLAESLYGGEDCQGILHDALLEADLPELAAHFERPFHPRGCWVVDAILKKR
jgi:hypothetical protein